MMPKAAAIRVESRWKSGPLSPAVNNIPDWSDMVTRFARSRYVVTAMFRWRAKDGTLPLIPAKTRVRLRLASCLLRISSAPWFHRRRLNTPYGSDAASPHTVS